MFLAFLIFSLLIASYLFFIFSLRRGTRRLSQRRPQPTQAPAVQEKGPPPIVGTVTITRGAFVAELDVNKATFMFVRAGERRVMAYYVESDGNLQHQPVFDSFGSAHPGAHIKVFDAVDPTVDEPLMIVVRPDLEESRFDVSPRMGIPPSILWDYEISTIVRFKPSFKFAESPSDGIIIEAEARTAGGPGGEPARFRIQLRALFKALPPRELEDSENWKDIQLKMIDAEP